MRTSRDPYLRSAIFVGNFCLALGASLSPTGASAQSTAAETKTKYVYKAVPCTPCPCECPDARAVRETPFAAPAAQTMVSPAPAPAPEPGAVAHAPAHAPAPTAAPVAQSAPAAKQVEQARGSIAGTVLVRDRNGAEKADRSDVVVYLESISKKYAALKKPRAMAQRDKAFAPKLVAVTVGSTVDFPNEDKFFHNVFSLSEGSTFDLGLYRAGESKSVTFDKTGVVDVYCNIHPNMWAQILVLANPFFTTTVKDGSFELGKVPPGTYMVDAWISGGSEPVHQQLKVEPGKRAELKLEIREGAANKQHLNKNNQPYGRYK